MPMRIHNGNIRDLALCVPNWPKRMQPFMIAIWLSVGPPLDTMHIA